MKLSIGMMVKNEEVNLERCLGSLKPLMQAISSELIVVDTGSTDHTVEIAKRYTDQVYLHPWENDYSKMRNYSVNYAKGDWFFFIDADEELVEHAAIVDFLLSEKVHQYNAASIRIKNFYKKDDDRSFFSASVIRLFRRTKMFRFEGVIHEQPIFDPPLCILDATLNHYGYVSDDAELKERKLRLYEPILQKALEKNPRDIHYWYQLSRTYVSYKDKQAALEPAVRAYEIMAESGVKPEDYLYVYSNLSHLYLVNGSPIRAIEIAEEGLKIKEWVVDLWFYLAKAQMEARKQEGAIESYKKYLYYADHFSEYADRDLKVFSFTLTGKEDAYLDLSRLYKETGRHKEAVEELEKIESDEIQLKAVEHGIALFTEMREYDLLKRFYEKIKLIDNGRRVHHFHRMMEQLLLNHEEGRNEVYRTFRNEEAEYGILNRIRLLEDPQKIDAGLLGALEKLPMNQLDHYYGDVFYFVLKHKLPLKCVNHHLVEEKLNHFFQYLDDKHNDLPAVYYAYLQGMQKGYTVEEGRIIQILRRVILLAAFLEDEEYERVLMSYIEDGIVAIRQIYNENLLDGGHSHLLKSKEDAFFLYMESARKAESSDPVGYIRNLKKALQAYSEMKKGIEILLKRVTEKSDDRKPKVSNEMEAYAQIVKNNIMQLVDKKMFQEARTIIGSFEQILPNDPDIARIKAYLKDLK